MAKLAKIEDWVAPWEKDLKEGDEPEVELPKLKTYLHGLLSDKEKAQERVIAAEAETATFKKQVEEKAREGETSDAKASRELEEANKRADAAEKTAKDSLRLRIALRKNLTERQANRLRGDTEEELEADADELLADFTPQAKVNTENEDDEEDDDKDQDSLRGIPKLNLRNGSDPKGSNAGEEADPAARAEARWQRENAF